jgi:hypothetical protein
MGFDPHDARNALIAFKNEEVAINYLLEDHNETSPGPINHKRKKEDN